MTHERRALMSWVSDLALGELPTTPERVECHTAQMKNLRPLAPVSVRYSS